MRFLRHVTAWLLAGSLAACGNGGVSVPINKDAFTQAFVIFVHERFPDAETNVRDAGSDDISVNLKWPDGAGFTWYPDNGYQQYRLDPAQLDAIMQRHLDSLGDLRAKKNNKSTPISSTQILPVVKTRDWLDGVEKLTRKNAKDEKTLQDNLPLYRPLAGELVVTYVEDRDNAMHFVGRADLVRTGANDVYGLDALARGNFEKRLDSMRVVDEGDRYRLELDTNYEASLALFIDRLRDKVAIDGDPVIVIAARDTVMICGSKDRNAIESMHQAARQIAHDSPYGLSDALYTLRDGRLVNY